MSQLNRSSIFQLDDKWMLAPLGKTSDCCIRIHRAVDFPEVQDTEICQIFWQSPNSMYTEDNNQWLPRNSCRLCIVLNAIRSLFSVTVHIFYVQPLCKCGSRSTIGIRIKKVLFSVQDMDPNSPAGFDKIQRTTRLMKWFPFDIIYKS